MGSLNLELSPRGIIRFSTHHDQSYRYYTSSQCTQYAPRLSSFYDIRLHPATNLSSRILRAETRTFSGSFVYPERPIFFHFLREREMEECSPTTISSPKKRLSEPEYPGPVALGQPLSGFIRPRGPPTRKKKMFRRVAISGRL